MSKQSNVKDEILEKIEKMSVLELSELVKSLEEKFGVSAQAPQVVGVAQAAAGAQGAGAAEEEQTEFSVVLESSGDKKIQVIKVVRELTGLGLKEAKDLVDNVPKAVKEGVEKAAADEIKSKLEATGAKVTIK